MTTNAKFTIQKKLIDAIRAKDIHLIQSAIDAGANIDYHSPSLTLPLLAAVETQDLSIVIKIKELGAKFTIYHLFGSGNSTKINKKLFLHPNLDIIIYLKSLEKHFPNNIECQLFNYALKNSYLHIARYILEHNLYFFSQKKSSKVHTKETKIKNKLAQQQHLQHNTPFSITYLYNSQYNLPSYSSLPKKSQQFLKHSKYIDKSFFLLNRYISSFSNKKNQILFFKLYQQTKLDLPHDAVNRLFSVACSKGNMELVLFLFDDNKNIDLHWQEESHLIFSISSKNLDLFHFLIEKGANIYHKIDTPFHFVQKALWKINVYNCSFLTYLFEQGFDMLTIRENLDEEKKAWLDSFLHQKYLDSNLPQSKHLHIKITKL